MRPAEAKQVQLAAAAAAAHYRGEHANADSLLQEATNTGAALLCMVAAETAGKVLAESPEDWLRSVPVSDGALGAVVAVLDALGEATDRTGKLWAQTLALGAARET